MQYIPYPSPSLTLTPNPYQVRAEPTCIVQYIRSGVEHIGLTKLVALTLTLTLTLTPSP